MFKKLTGVMTIMLTTIAAYSNACVIEISPDGTYTVDKSGYLAGKFRVYEDDDLIGTEYDEEDLGIPEIWEKIV
jgi:hypothetical protein